MTTIGDWASAVLPEGIEIWPRIRSRVVGRPGAPGTRASASILPIALGPIALGPIGQGPIAKGPIAKGR